MNQKVIVITGASSGIGAGLALKLGSLGHRLVLGARRLSELQEIAKRTETETLAIKTDVTRRADVEELKKKALKKFGRVDVWINNAGQGITKKVLDLTDEDLDQMMLINMKSALYGMQAIIPVFKEQKSGHLVNISSFLARVPAASIRSAYSASKAALNSLTTNLRMDLKDDFPGIQVSTVMPGLVQTEFARNAVGSQTASSLPTPMKPQSVDEVVARILNVIEYPKPETYTNPTSPKMAQQFFQEIGAFEALE